MKKSRTIVTVLVIVGLLATVLLPGFAGANWDYMHDDDSSVVDGGQYEGKIVEAWFDTDVESGWNWAKCYGTLDMSWDGGASIDMNLWVEWAIFPTDWGYWDVPAEDYWSDSGEVAYYEPPTVSTQSIHKEYPPEGDELGTVFAYYPVATMTQYMVAEFYVPNASPYPIHLELTDSCLVGII